MPQQSDILIIGSGLAGLSLALKLAEKFTVNLVTKREAVEANTRYAQGGIASVRSGTDNFESHVKDTLTAGAGLCHRDVVEKIVHDGPRLIDELIAWGVRFSRNEDEYDLGREGGHSERRILHAGDTTGREMENSLLQKVRNNSRITLHEFHSAIDLVLAKKISQKTTANKCLGAYVLDIKNNVIRTFEAKTTVLATGGGGKVYLYTSNPDVATGDGIAMAYRAGVPVANLEFVQFHPTCLYSPGAWASPGKKINRNSFLISEAVRGEGAVLKLKDGTPFMQNYHPLKELAPRDIVARAIDHEMKKSGDDYVLLDISHRDADFIKERFPNIYATCLENGLDITRDPIPVVPSAHYFCGGILTTVEGKTEMPGLYAIGEAACTGLHGANRLASNSLLEAYAMADYAAQSIAKEMPGIKTKEISIPQWNPGKATPSDEAVLISQNWDEIRRLMWNYVGIVRSNKRLSRAQRRIRILNEEIKEYYWDFTITSDLIELRNLACVAELIINSAMTRKESRGLHYNLDYPEMREEERKDTILRMA